MALRDCVIAGFAETKIQYRSGSEPFTLDGAVMDELLGSTGFAKHEVDGLIVTPSASAASAGPVDRSSASRPV